MMLEQLAILIGKKIRLFLAPHIQKNKFQVAKSKALRLSKGNTEYLYNFEAEKGFFKYDTGSFPNK